MKYLLFNIKAEQPLLLTSLQGDPNSSVSFPYIPGSVIRGAFITKYCQKHYAGGKLKLEDSDARRLFFNGSTHFLHAYPLVENKRSLPIPRCLTYEKQSDWIDNARDVFDRSVTTPPDTVLKTFTDGFLAYGTSQSLLRFYSVEKLVHIHNQRDRPHGRGFEGQGALFRYEAIAPDHVFQAVIICDTDSDADVLKDLICVHEDNVGDIDVWLPQQAWLGGSRSAGYGAVIFDNGSIISTWAEAGIRLDKRFSFQQVLDNQEDSEDEDEESTVQQIESDTSVSKLILLLTSDLFLSSGINDQYPYFNFIRHLSKLLKVNVRLDEELSFIGTNKQGGFNRTWGLPLPQQTAFTAGSIFALHLDPGVPLSSLTLLETRGLGERRAEGFGRVVCNWLPGTATFKVLRVQHIPFSATVPTLQSEQSKRIAKMMASRMLIQRLEMQLIKLVQDNPLSGTVSNTQLSRLRIIARRAAAKKDISLIQKLLINLPSNARHQFETARINNQSLYHWLAARVQNPELDWGDPKLQVLVAGETAGVSHELATRYTLRLIMAIARLTTKRLNRSYSENDKRSTQ